MQLHSLWSNLEVKNVEQQKINLSVRIILRNAFKIEISNVEGASESINYGVLLVLFGGRGEEDGKNQP